MESTVVLFLGFVALTSGSVPGDLIRSDLESPKIFFYNLKVNQTFNESLMARARRPAEKNCLCTQTQCDCCAGLKFPRLKIDRQVCTKLNYDRYTSLLRMGIIMNGKEVAENTIYVRQSDGSGGQEGEGANPSPFCLPIPIPFFNIELCVKLFDLTTPGPNLHMCMDWMARIASVPIIVLHFDCMQIGLDGVNFMKPGETIEERPPDVNPIGPTGPTGGIITPESPTPVAPVSPVAPAPVQPPDSGIITSPSGPNLPQVGGDGSDFDPVDDVKKKPCKWH